MQSFLKAEWKTILVLILFGGALFSWFYIDEIKKAEKAAAPYEYTCIKPGSGFMDYRLGMSVSELSAQLVDFTQTQDDALHIARYARSDGALSLTFRMDQLASIEYRPNTNQPNPSCDADIAEFKKTHNPTSEAITANGEVWTIYQGLIGIQPQVFEVEGDETPTAPKTIGWIVMSN